MKPSDALWGLLVVTAFLAAALPWSFGADPSETMVWGFAVAPPLVLGLLLGIRERWRSAT